MRPTRLAAILAAACVLLVAALAEAKTIGSGSGSGKRAFAGATANITAPRLVAARVTSTPAQRATGRWQIVCERRKGRPGQRSGRFSGRGRFTRVIGFPRGSRKSCFVAVAVRLAGTGRIKLEVLGH